MHISEIAEVDGGVLTTRKLSLTAIAVPMVAYPADPADVVRSQVQASKAGRSSKHRPWRFLSSDSTRGRNAQFAGDAKQRSLSHLMRRGCVAFKGQGEAAELVLAAQMARLRLF